MAAAGVPEHAKYDEAAIRARIDRTIEKTEERMCAAPLSVIARLSRPGARPREIANHKSPGKLAVWLKNNGYSIEAR
eukprot:gene11292-12530_t